MTPPDADTPLTAEELSLLDRLDATRNARVRNAIERRLTEIATDPDGVGGVLPVNAEGKVRCAVDGRSTFPENWANHLLGQGEHRPATLDAARSSPAPAGLDVERLRLAVETVARREYPGMDRGGGIAYTTPGADTGGLALADIAAEYAVLSPTTETTDHE